MSSGIFAWFTTLVNPDMNNLNILIEPFCVGVRPVPDGLRILAWPLAEFWVDLSAAVGGLVCGDVSRPAQYPGNGRYVPVYETVCLSGTLDRRWSLECDYTFSEFPSVSVLATRARLNPISSRPWARRLARDTGPTRTRPACAVPGLGRQILAECPWRPRCGLPAGSPGSGGWPFGS